MTAPMEKPMGWDQWKRFDPVPGLLGTSQPSGHIGFPRQTTAVRHLVAGLTC